MALMQILDDLLEHIKQVESETMALSRDAQLRLTAFIDAAQLVPDDATLEAMQYQDIVSQQLGATVETIESIQASLRECGGEIACCDDTRLGSCEAELAAALARAQEKRLAFGGKMHHDEDAGIEFF